MEFARYLAREWKPALGCTEPASVAYAAARAAAEADGPVRSVHLSCDPRLYKNCFAVGIPHSGGRTGILWSAAIGALLPDASAGLECFGTATPEVLAGAGRLVEAGAITVEVDPGARGLRVDVRVVRGGGVGRAVIEGTHTRLVRLERDGRPVPVPGGAPDDGSPGGGGADDEAGLAAWLEGLAIPDMVELARSVTPADRERLRDGIRLNRAIADHGLGLFPDVVREGAAADTSARAGWLVCAGVHARMSGADLSVMTLAGSGNKGITTAVPLDSRGRREGMPPERVDEALALACLVTSRTTRRLGTLSSVCGCANAAAVGLAAGLVHLRGGDGAALARAVHNMVGNLTGVICDGAKIGCGLKAMTGVDAALRAGSLALAGVGIPATDGIVAEDPEGSLDNLERVARQGMRAMDGEILRIMQDKLR